MKHTTAILAALALAWPALTLAQDEPRAPRRGDGPPPNRDGGPGGPGQRMAPPLMAALDANHDGVIDADEIKNAPEALRKLDKNNDGKVTMDELRPPRPEGGPDGRPEGEQVTPRGGNGREEGPRSERPARRTPRAPEGQ